METKPRTDNPMKPRTDLPMKLITAILSFLPAKTLLRFKSVSKTWYALIHSPQFISMHRTAHKITNLVIINTPLKLHRKLPNKFYQWNKSLSNNPLHELIPEPPIFSSPRSRYRHFQFHGSCDGLVCCSLAGRNASSLYVWNPSTRKLKLIKTESFPNDTRHNYGIGKRVVAGADGDGGGDDYRVVSFTYERTSKGRPSTSFASIDIYTLSTNSWKRINAIIRGYIRCPSVSIKGVLYWLCSKQRVEEAVIVSFNLQREVHREIALPIFAPMVDWFMHIVDSKGSLALIAKSDGATFSIWLMKEKEYGALDRSWDKLFSVSLDRPDEYWPIYFGSNGFLLSKRPDRRYKSATVPELFMVDFEKQQLINIGEDSSLLEERYCNAVDFTESLVLLNEK